MHDCQATKVRLIDLIFGEADDAEALGAQVRSCAACAAEYRALSETVRAFDRASDEARPPEEFWPRYHARLARRLDAVGPEAVRAPAGRAPARSSSPAAWLRRALTARWSVPAPAAVAALLLVVCLTPLALRRSSNIAAPPPREGDVAPAANGPQPVRTIEVPVVREKIVTRTVYVTRPARKRTRSTQTDNVGLASGLSPAVTESAPRRDTLTGFQPAGDVKLRVIKGSLENER